MFQKESLLYYLFSILLIAIVAVLINYCQKQDKEDIQYKQLEVTATAYNSNWNQTIGHPSEAAWGDTLKPGMKVIAVSRDLLDSGLTHMTKVEIKGLPGEYLVLDKMNARWTKKIDIYMGKSEKKAREWGKKKVTIKWKEKKPGLNVEKK